LERECLEVSEADRVRLVSEADLLVTFISVPTEPEGYAMLKWAPAPGAVQNLESVYRSAMRSAPKNRAAIAARELGWLFSAWQPDASL
jgi:hypothetical protein